MANTDGSDSIRRIMARRPRFAMTDVPLHVVQRGHDRRACFFDERDYRTYLTLLRETSARCEVSVHAYVLMTNHVHLLLTPHVIGSVPKMMQLVGASYVRYINRSRIRTGTLWEGRYRASLVETDRHLLAACRYIDFNPVRAGLVADVSEYRWSSYPALAGLRQDPLVTRHIVLEQLGTPPGEAYARWCNEGEVEADVQALRNATAGELAFGSDAFKHAIEASTRRALFAKPPGFKARPKPPPFAYHEP